MRREAVGLAVSLDLEGRSALVVGGDDEAADKVERLLEAGAQVRVVAERPGPAVEGLARQGRIALAVRGLFAADVRQADVVLFCDRDPERGAQVAALAREQGAAVWCCDLPAHSDFAMPALARAGRLRVAISTGGAAPAVAARLRAALERDLEAPFRAFLDRLAKERARLLTEEPDPAARRARLKELAERVSFHLAVAIADE